MTALLSPPPQPLAESSATAAPGGRKLNLAWLAVSAITFGLAIQINYGQYHPIAITWLSLAMLSALLALRAATVESRARLLALLAGGLVVEFYRLVWRALFPTVSASLTLGVFTWHESIFLAIFTLAAAVCAAGIFWARLRKWAFAGLIAMHIALGVVLIYSYPTPPIDVYFFERDAATALIHGHEPYAVQFRNIYGQDSVRNYGPGTSINGVLQYGYPYPPVPLLLGVPGLIAGDPRYAYLLAVSAAGILLATMRRHGASLDPVGVAAAALLMFLPSQFLVIQCGFSEPAPVFLLAATVWTALRHPRWLAIPLGLLLVCKQYMVFAVPAAWLLIPAIARTNRRRIAMETIAIGTAVSLPFAAIAGKRFWQSVVIWQFHQPFRSDALSYPALLANCFPTWSVIHHMSVLAPVAGFASGSLMLVICLRRLPRTPAGFAAAVGLTLAAFFAFNKQAFCNYYYFVIAAFCTAIAASFTMEPTSRQDAE